MSDSDGRRRGLTEIVQHDAGWLPVVAERERYVGVLTPDAAYATLRRAVSEGEREIA